LRARSERRTDAAQDLHMLLKLAAAICNRLKLRWPFGTETITATRLRRLIAGQRRTRSAALFKAKAG
jgi:hypothetical protein